MGSISLGSNVAFVEVVGPELIVFVMANAFVLPFDILAAHLPHTVASGTSVFADVIAGIIVPAGPPPCGADGGSVVFHDGRRVFPSVIDVCVTCEDMYIAITIDRSQKLGGIVQS